MAGQTSIRTIFLVGQTILLNVLVQAAKPANGTCIHLILASKRGWIGIKAGN
jgi:hypothetical protein